MSKTRHPKEYAKSVSKALDEVVDSVHFDTAPNTERNDMQASMTVMVDSVGSVPLGTGGETKGFAKSIDPNAARKGGSRLIKGDFGDGADCGLITRQVATCKADRFLGLNSVAEERYGRNDQGQIVGISVQAPGCNVLSNKGVFQVDCSDPRIQRGLSDLEVSDFITGQTDRHSGNIFIDPSTGKVTGIDNDLSFPEKALNKVGAQSVDRIVGMPQVIHQDTKAKILAADPEAFRQMLSVPPPRPGPSPMSQEAINGAVGRLKALQRELQKDNPSIQVVTAFNKQTYTNALTAQNDEFKQTVGGQSLDMHAYGQLSTTDKAKLPVKVLKSYDQINKKSYLGTVELEMAKNRVLPPQHVVPEHKTVPTPINRLPKEVLEQKLAQAYEQMSPAERKTFDKDLERLNKMESSFETKQKHLNKPSLLDKIKAVGLGTTAVRDTKQQHADMLDTDIRNLKAQLEQQADMKLTPVALQMPNLPPLPNLPDLPSSNSVGSSGTSTSDVSYSEDDSLEISGDGALSQSEETVPKVTPKKETVLESLRREGGTQTKIEVGGPKNQTGVDGDQTGKSLKSPKTKVGGR